MRDPTRLSPASQRRISARRSLGVQVAWAFLAAVGASYLVTSAGLTALTPLLQWVFQIDRILQDRGIFLGIAGIDHAATWSLALAGGAGAGALVARTNGGPRAAAVWMAFVAAEAAIVVGRAIEARRRAVDSFTIMTTGNVPEAAALMFVPVALALAVGWRRGSGSARCHAILESAGVYALVSVPVVALALRQPLDLMTAPYSTGLLDAVPHAFLVVLQALLAAGVYALRATDPTSAVRAALGLGAVGLAAVAPSEVMPIALTLFLDWSHVPVSLAVVPLVTALAGAGAVLARSATARGTRSVATRQA